MTPTRKKVSDAGACQTCNRPNKYVWVFNKINISALLEIRICYRCLKEAIHWADQMGGG